jgi:hypothetical protein
MQMRLVTASMLGLSLLAGCPKRSPADERAPTTPAADPTPTPTPAMANEPTTPAPAPEPFDWARVVADGDHHLAVAVAQRTKRFTPAGANAAATPEVVLQADPPVKARAVFREGAGCGGEEGGGDCEGRWSLEVTVGQERWQIVDFATWTTDCAAIEDGFGRDGIHLEARELVPGGPQELVIEGHESHAAYLDDCDCTTRGGTSEHLWACGLVAEGKAWRPVCWAHVERNRDVGPTMDPADCACAAKVAHEAWEIEAELVAPGQLRVTHDGRTDTHELTTLPCRASAPPAEFGCAAKPAP